MLLICNACLMVGKTQSRGRHEKHIVEAIHRSLPHRKGGTLLSGPQFVDQGTAASSATVVAV